MLISVRILAAKLRALVRRERPESAFDEEILAHIELLTQRYLDQGLPPEEARVSARRQFGNLGLQRQERRDLRVFPALDNLFQDLCLLARRFQRRKATHLHLALILAVGIGCVIGTFDIAYGVLHRPLPGVDPDRIVVSANGSNRRLLHAYNRINPQAESIFEKSATYIPREFNLLTEDGVLVLRAALISPDFFPLFGIRRTIGRNFTSDEYWPDPGPIPALPVILSPHFWRDRFASSEAVLGQTLQFSESLGPLEIIGVAPPEANFPLGVDLWLPIYSNYGASLIQSASINTDPYEIQAAVGLLKPGLSPQAAQGVMRGWQEVRLFPSGQDGVPQLTSLRDHVAGEVYPLSLKAWYASLFFLLLIVAATATIFRTEAEFRRTEFAIKGALGAARARLFRSVCLESALVIAVALIASFAVRAAVVQLAAATLPLAEGLNFGVRRPDFALAAGTGALAFLVSVGVQSATLWGWRLGRAAPESLAVRSRPLKRRQFWPHLQLVPAVMILIIAALFARTAYQTMRIDPGVNPGNVFVAQISFSTNKGTIISELRSADRRGVVMTREEDELYWRLYRQRMEVVSGDLIDTLERHPSIRHAALISTAPYKDREPTLSSATYSASQSRAPDAPAIFVAIRTVTPGALEALGIRLFHGTTFSGAVAADADTAVINQAMAEQIGLGDLALGQYIHAFPFGSRTVRIVGIVENVREQDIYSEPVPTVYLPFSQDPNSDVDLVVRTADGVPSADVLRLIETAVTSAAPRTAVSQFRAMPAMVASAGTLSRSIGYYLLALSVLAVWLAGFCASAKTLAEFHRRKREVGIRMALGSTKAKIVGLFVYCDLIRSLPFVAGGILLAWWFARLVQQLLYDVDLLDPISYLAGAAVLLGAIVFAQILLLKNSLRENPRDLIDAP